MSTEDIPSRPILALIAFCSGAVVMSMELAGSRLVAPFLGSSLFVWTSLIGVILGFLSLGYWLGGRLADTHPELLGRMLILASASLALVSLLEYPLLVILSNLQLDVRLGAVIAASILFGIPSVLLGTVTPFAARLAITKLATSGATIGSLYAVSTLGSIFGTFVTGFYLFSVIGSSILLLLLSVILMFLALLSGLKSHWKAAVLLILFQLGAYALHLDFLSQAEARGLRIKDTRYHRVLILDEKNDEGRIRRLLVTDPYGAQSAMWLDAPKELEGTYSAYYDLGVYATSKQGNFLMLGGGAYSYPKYFSTQFPKAHLDVVEIDPELEHLARKYFSLRTEDNLSLLTADARIFLRNSTTRYDAIFMDVFSSAPEVPFHVSTDEFFALTRERLKPGGMLILNIIAAAEGEGASFLKPLAATLGNNYANLEAFLVRYPEHPQAVQNILLLATTEGSTIPWESLPSKLGALHAHRVALPKTDAIAPLTDDFAPVENLMTKVYQILAQQHRNKERKDDSSARD